MTAAKVIITACAAGVAILLLPKLGAVNDQEDENYQEPDLLDQADAFFQEITDTGGDPMQDQNVRAFLWMIRVSEGTAGENGYRTLVGGALFDSYGDHPRALVYVPSIGRNSSAAGAYQILRGTWDGVRAKLGLSDFSPASQDAAAVELIRQRGGLALVRAGRFVDAVEKCKKEWASLPGAGYGQRENTLARLQTAYKQAGGYLA